MELLVESVSLDNYLTELEEVNFSNPSIMKLLKQLFNEKQTDIEKTKIAFHFVRDTIAHSWDIKNRKATCRASEVLKYKHGICYAKSNLLAALLRGVGIPTGF